MLLQIQPQGGTSALHSISISLFVVLYPALLPVIMKPHCVSPCFTTSLMHQNGVLRSKVIFNIKRYVK